MKHKPIFWIFTPGAWSRAEFVPPLIPAQPLALYFWWGAGEEKQRYGRKLLHSLIGDFIICNCFPPMHVSFLQCFTDSSGEDKVSQALGKWFLSFTPGNIQEKVSPKFLEYFAPPKTLVIWREFYSDWATDTQILILSYRISELLNGTRRKIRSSWTCSNPWKSFFYWEYHLKAEELSRRKWRHKTIYK